MDAKQIAEEKWNEYFEEFLGDNFTFKSDEESYPDLEDEVKDMGLTLLADYKVALEKAIKIKHKKNNQLEQYAAGYRNALIDILELIDTVKPKA